MLLFKHLQSTNYYQGVNCPGVKSTPPCRILLISYIYISRKTLRSLRPEITEFAGQGTGQGNTVQDRSWQRDRAKVEQSVALCNINKQLCRAGPKRTASKKWVKI